MKILLLWNSLSSVYVTNYEYENDDQNEFILEDIAKYCNCSINDADILMTDFTVLGFVDYNRDENVIHLNEKLLIF